MMKTLSSESGCAIGRFAGSKLVLGIEGLFLLFITSGVCQFLALKGLLNTGSCAPGS